ncbi:LysR family transcriptional regulator [Falsiphaeobacter marinintestinus]|uniref:LysR family transcriptional regulator n=1 Tax=Falsiphaeobacter marinintestinus TaxID=1492905 RepID=UPI0011B806F7|nr:LysR family transcriptional regulator [Phaeobacter marinintestinus]
MTVDWDDLKTVLALVRSGSLAGAGTALGINYTTVARRVQRAEAAMGAVLFEKLPSGYVATETGRMVADHAAQMEGQQDALLRLVQGRDQSLQGNLVITAPQLLIGPYVAPVLAAFTDAHPQIDLYVKASNDLLNLNRREADLAIRISRTPGDTLKGLRLAEQYTGCFASPEIVARIAKDPNDPIDWLIYESYTDIPAFARAIYPSSRVRMTFDDMVAQIGAAQAGLGVVRMPLFLGRRTPGLVQVPNLPPQPYADIWVVGHPDVWRTAKLQAFRDILVPYFRSRRSEFVTDVGSDHPKHAQSHQN